jgi:hypothetical protein
MKKIRISKKRLEAAKGDINRLGAAEECLARLNILLENFNSKSFWSLKDGVEEEGVECEYISNYQELIKRKSITSWNVWYLSYDGAYTLNMSDDSEEVSAASVLGSLNLQNKDELICAIALYENIVKMMKARVESHGIIFEE